ncbi:hypothetical protein ASG52_25150 [Methylobacterium sp. Leaf456]|uniref:DUF6894 family protein n=1 Tax=Methylobacterium sp. Leaf456 TaxID=1736382 RepID=UPI0006F279B1|nr:hypothetical protein [Methylobacterium sp. Leaf456]KQT55055.1 hypothetical protein ASG52_25150 [Methylobacterium sp. Leaf456]
MPRYFFDVQDGYPTKDDYGTVLDGSEAIAATAIRTLFEIGQLEATRNAGREFLITVRDEAGTKVYRAELTVRAEWLTKVA